MTVKYSSVQSTKSKMKYNKDKLPAQHRHVLIYSNQPTQVLGIYSSISIRCPGMTVKYSSMQFIDV